MLATIVIVGGKVMIDLEELRQAIRDTFKAKNPRMTPLYNLLRDELRPFGFWRTRPRGNPRKGFEAMKAKTK